MLSVTLLLFIVNKKYTLKVSKYEFNMSSLERKAKPTAVHLSLKIGSYFCSILLLYKNNCLQVGVYNSRICEIDLNSGVVGIKEQ